MEILTSLEQHFIQVYGNTVFHSIRGFIIESDILDFYLKARQTPCDLFDFGFHYGIVEIVAFCYCVLKCHIDINTVVNGYYKSIESSPEIAEGNRLCSITAPVESLGGKAGIVIETIDKFTPSRRKCIKFMILMKKFSRYKVEKRKFIYRIVEKYVEPYRLLEVQVH